MMATNTLAMSAASLETSSRNIQLNIAPAVFCFFCFFKSLNNRKNQMEQVIGTVQTCAIDVSPARHTVLLSISGMEIDTAEQI